MSVSALIVDDSKAYRQIISHILRNAGCTIAGEAVNATQGLSLFRELKPNIVTLDLMMPRFSNIDSMTLLRTIKREMPEGIVIIVSVLSSEETRQDLLRQGALAYIVKPINDSTFEPVHRQLMQIFPELATTHS